MKKILSLILVAALALTCVGLMAGCSGETGTTASTDDTDAGKIPSDFKIGLICLHDKNSTYDKNFIVAMEQVQEELGLSDDQVIIATGIPEGAECKDKAVEMAEAGCKVIMADSFGHEQYMMEAARQYPDVLFAHATGTKALLATDLPNYVNAFASIYEGRYLAGVVAGLKLKSMIDAGKVTADKAKVGYIGAFTYAEVISGYTSWFLGVRSIVPEATMEVTFTGSWYDETAENNAAKKLISNGCVLISQHADSMGAPNACEEAGVPNVSYNGSTYAAAPNTFLVSSRINWAPYYKYLIDCKVNNKTADKNYVGTIKTDSVQLTDLGDAVADGTTNKLAEVKAAIVAGTLHVFDTSTFTVSLEANPNKDLTLDADGRLTSYKADVKDEGDYVGETEVISDGYFHESEYRSAPYFDLTIDGITLLDTNFG